jgi:DNA-binding MarR family transcriptional regulator
VSQKIVEQLMLTNKLLTEHLDKEFAKTGLKKASFEVLSTLFYSGAPYSLTPNQLLDRTHVTSGSMTSRIDKLVKKGWVERVVNSQDKRSIKVSLTSSGESVILAALQEHEETLTRLLSVLTDKEQVRLSAILSKFLSKTSSQ